MLVPCEALCNLDFEKCSIIKIIIIINSSSSSNSILLLLHIVDVRPYEGTQHYNSHII